MKKLMILLFAILGVNSAIAQNCGGTSLQPNQTGYQQNNSFPLNGQVGINTGSITPAAPLHIIARTNRGSSELMRFEIYHSTTNTLIPNTSWKLGMVYYSQSSVNYSALTFQSPTCTGIGSTFQFKSNGEFISAGKIIAPEVFVTTTIPWADYVFKPDYHLRPLCEVNSFIGLHGHLPGMPSAVDVQLNGGFEMGRLNILLLEKVEELTLYSIQQENTIRSQGATIQSLEQRISELEKIVKPNNQN